ncbi:hypothetical protein [Algirhabdus cladophorae]|uniref:hypothetical protein n=1 Tax=Algirhabdus cladophorae TaxID=3377108 RepID=UPI003B84746C
MFDLDRLEEFDRCLEDLKPVAPAPVSFFEKYSNPTPAKPQCPYQKATQSA